MSDQTDSQVANEDTNGSQPAISQKQSGETQSGNSLAGAALAELALKDPEAAEQLRRHYQSEKDRGVEQAKKTAQTALDEVTKIAQRLNISPEQVEKVRKDLLVEELYQERYGDSRVDGGGQKPVETQQAASRVDIAQVKAAYNDIDFNDPKVLQALSNHMNDQDRFLAALGKIKLDNVAKPKPNAASVTPPSGNVKASQTIDDLQAEYQSLLNDPVSFSKPENKARRAEIIRQMEELENA